jgi:hypothetical protein
MGTQQRQRFRWPLVMLFLLALVPLTASAAPTEVWHYSVETTDPPNPGDDWGTVTQLLTSSGCDGSSCGSSWRPRNDSYTILLENAGDRVSRAHGDGDGSPPYDATVIYRRQTCPTDGAWAAGTWHHNFQARSRLEQTSFRAVERGGQTHYYITLTQRWSSRYYQSFAHNDPCLSADPITPTPTLPGGAAPPPTPQPTAPPDQPTYTPLPIPTDVPTLTPTQGNPCVGGGPRIPDSSYSLWTPLDLASAAPGPVLTSTVALRFAQTPHGFGEGLKEWKEQFITLDGPVSGRLVWAYDEGTDHGEPVRELRNNDRRRITFASPEPGKFRLLWSGHPNQPTIQFTTLLANLPDGAYRIVSNTRNVACTPRFNEQTFYFQVGEALPPPPAPSARLFGWARSPHDSAASLFYSTQSNSDPMHFAWAYGGMLVFYPDVALSLPEESGYRVAATISGWHFHGSPPLDSTPVDQALAYRAPIQILWSKYPPAGLHPPAAYAYRIARVDEPVTIAVTVDYTYQYYDMAGVPIGAPLDGSIEGQFSVALVYPQVLDGGRP